MVAPRPTRRAPEPVDAPFPGEGEETPIDSVDDSDAATSDEEYHDATDIKLWLTLFANQVVPWSGFRPGL